MGEKCHFMISDPSDEFLQISRTNPFWTITKKLGYHRFCEQWVPKQLADVHNPTEWAQLWCYQEEEGEFLKESWLETRHLLNLFQTSTENSNKHFQTKKLWLQCSVFWDHTHMATTITSEAIQNRRCRMLIKAVAILHAMALYRSSHKDFT